MISEREKIFRRAILSFNTESMNPRAIDVAVDLAFQLQLDLLGLYVMDQMLETALHYPWAREFRSQSKEWKILNKEDVQKEQHFIASHIQKSLSKKAQERKLLSSFQITSGKYRDVVGQISTTTDILVLFEPEDRLEKMTKSFGLIMETANQLPASTLYLRGNAIERRGVILVLAEFENDPGVILARTIAESTQEKIIVLDIKKFPQNKGTIDPLSKEPMVLTTELHRASLIIYRKSNRKFGIEDVIALLPQSYKTPVLILK